jgi:hypothetical protein
MQKWGWLLFAITLLGSTGLVGAQTQPQTVPNTSASTAPVPTSTKTVPANTVGTAGQPNFGQVIASLNNVRASVAKVQSMNGGSANNLRPINVAAMSGADPAALSSAITKNQSQLNGLRNALNRTMVTTSTNERISIAQFLADNRIMLNQVVGADMSNGMLLLYYQK